MDEVIELAAQAQEFRAFAGRHLIARAGQADLELDADASRMRLEADDAVAEVLPGYEASLWNGIGAPRATPPEIIAKLNAALNEGLNDPKIKAQFAAMGGMTSPVTPAEYGRIIKSETEKWAKVIRSAGIKAQ